MPYCDAKTTIDAHNKLREKHGSPPLQWSDECAEYALRAAKRNASSNCMMHCETKSQSGKQFGQNIFMGQPPRDPNEAVNDWQSELYDPGYDFNVQGYSSGTGHFTQVVWKETTHVGMSVSDDGLYIVANYYPAGNWTMSGQYKRNVLPLGSSQSSTDNLKESKQEYGSSDNKKDERYIGFTKQDADGNGQLDRNEWKNMLTKMGSHRISSQIANQLFDQYDLNHDGVIDYKEQLNFCKTFNIMILKSFEQDDDFYGGSTGFGLSDTDFFGGDNFGSNSSFGKSDDDFFGGKSPFNNPNLSKMSLSSKNEGTTSNVKLGKVVADSWTSELEQACANCPFKDMINQIKNHAKQGKHVEVIRTEGSIKVLLKSGNSTSTLSGSWS